ncbi:hypothetical protein GCM10027169_30690 [Gordonia jinhuaensis]|uniref:Uncharacterized protein n=1 Tax=Gordonia jinhuaensis TaxID=1517702 RepID=A0A916T7X5_9ACTN|nr:hypothetical protein [Gordonia jinhuaensis]GGB35274.1 hypothetical protein GCM10011489_24140 [Gordonia jinhuaensis]
MTSETPESDITSTDTAQSGAGTADDAGSDRRAGDIARDVSEAVLAVDGVAAMSGGRFGEVATYMPGHRIVGVKLSDEKGEVHIDVDLSRPILATANEVRGVAQVIAGRPMDVVVEDIAEPNTAGENAVGVERS